MRAVTNSDYRCFNIAARPYLLHESGRWAADLEVSSRDRTHMFGMAGRYVVRASRPGAICVTKGWHDGHGERAAIGRAVGQWCRLAGGARTDRGRRAEARL